MTSAGQVAIVTGANRGLGFEIVRQLARLGVRTVLAARDGAKAAAAAAALVQERLPVEPATLNVDDPASVQAACAACLSRYGRIDILVNNAGVLLDPGEGAASVLDMTRDQLLASFSTNTLGAFHTMQAVLPTMRQAGFGRIVNISSRAGQLDELRSGFPSYRVSKTALNSLTRVTAAEFKDTNIKINAMCPGWLKTAMGGDRAPLTAEQGADTAIWLAMLPADGPTGGFFRERKSLPW
ncbi:MAG: SDR family NAD(P)-dependent oxidoreductase [Hyphomicrobiaceae bacterium]